MSTSYSFSNQEISEILENVASALIVNDEDRFRIMAYENASQVIGNLSKDVKTYWQEGKLDEIPGIGKQMAAYLDELFKTGKVKHFSQIFHSLPSAFFTLLKIPGIGPKNSLKLCKALKINSAEKAIEQLKKAAEQGKIRTIESFGEKSEQDILKSISDWERSGTKMLLPDALNIADEVITYLKKCPEIDLIEGLGSLRRKASLVGDVDIAVTSNNPTKAIAFFTAYPLKKEVLAQGETKASIILNSGKQIDLRVVDKECWGSLFQHFTGSKEHNIHLREIALGKGLSLSEYGIKPATSNQLPAASNRLPVARNQQPAASKLIKFADEKKFYEYLGMDWIEPELRENRGEIEASLNHKLPKLIELKDIKGDLHLHSSFNIEPSHDLGVDSMEEMIRKAKQLNYSYLAFSEHSPSISQHSEKQIYDIIKRKKDTIDKLNYSRENKNNDRTNKLFIFNSLEIDINPNGERSISDRCLELLDFAIVSIHSSFKLDRAEMTKRILKALDHPKVKILGHPIGRLLNHRFGYEFDLEQVFQYCLKNNKYLEINSLPDRLDLPDDLIKEAIKFGVKMIINTDSHSSKQMDNMKFGVYNARRGWASTSDIINTLEYNKIKERLIE